MLGKLLKKILILSVVLALVWVGIFYLFQSKWIFEQFIIKRINERLEAVDISDVNISKQAFQFPGKIHLSDIDFLLVHLSEVYTIHIKDIRMDINPFDWGPRKNIIIQLNDVNAKSSQANIVNVNIIGEIYLLEDGFEGFKGRAEVGDFQRGDIRVSNIDTHVLGYVDNLKFDHFRADLYGGRALGKITLDIIPHLAYIVEMSIEGIELDRLKNLAPQFFARIKGNLQGSVLVKGDARNIDFVHTNLEIAQNGKIKAALLNYLFQFLPHQIENAELSRLINLGEFVPLDTATILLYSLTKDRMTSQWKLQSQKVNLNADVKIDFNVEGGLKNLFVHFNRIFGE